MMNDKLHDTIRQAVDRFNEAQEGPDAVYLPLESIGGRIGETGTGPIPTTGPDGPQQASDCAYRRAYRWEGSK